MLWVLRRFPWGCLGAGETSSLVVSELVTRGVDVDGIVRDPERVAVKKTRVMAGGARTGRSSRSSASTATTRRRCRRRSRHACATLRWTGSGSARACCFRITVTGRLPRPCAMRFSARRERAAFPCRRFALRAARVRGVTYATANEDEAQAAWGRPIRGDVDLRPAAETLRKALDAEFLLLTRGRDGMAVAERSGSFARACRCGARPKPPA